MVITKGNNFIIYLVVINFMFFMQILIFFKISLFPSIIKASQEYNYSPSGWVGMKLLPRVMEKFHSYLSTWRIIVYSSNHKLQSRKKNKVHHIPASFFNSHFFRNSFILFAYFSKTHLLAW